MSLAGHAQENRDKPELKTCVINLSHAVVLCRYERPVCQINYTDGKYLLLILLIIRSGRGSKDRLPPVGDGEPQDVVIDTQK